MTEYWKERNKEGRMKKIQIRNSLLLLLTAIIWGVAFVAQSTGMEYVEPFTFTCIRNIIGGIVLIPCVFLFGKIRKKQGPIITKTELVGGICCGVALCVATSFQQVGILHTTVGKAGFITALYVVVVPILGLFMKKRVSFLIWICVILSVIGLYLLCITEGNLALGYGDFLILICAVLFSVHILIIDYFSPKGDGVVISCIQFLTCGVIAGVGMVLTEQPTVTAILEAKWSILYAGVLSCGVAYTLQVVGQKEMNPVIASMILCLESVVAVLAGWLLLHEALSTRELLGCGLMFIAIMMAQIPVPIKKKERA